MRLSSLLPFALGVALIPHTYAWGAVGHEVVATIAQMHLHPTVMPKICHILDLSSGKCHLATVASWADSARRQAKYKWTGPLHYIGAKDDYPSAICAFPGPNGWNGRTHINVLHAIRNTTSVLQEYEELRSGADDQTEPVPSYVRDAVKFLIHFLGDMHMPLHLTGRNRGGNEDKVSFDGRTTNLHSLWDSLLISERLRTLPQNYTDPLPLPAVEFFLRDTIYDPYIRRIVWEGLLGNWEDELDEWLVCPSSTSSNQGRRRPQPQPEPVSASPWQYILSLLSSPVGKSDGEDSGDGGLDVDDDTVCPYAWAKPIHQLNCEIVYPKALDEPPYSQQSPLFTSRLFNPRAWAASERKHAHTDDTLEDEDEDGDDCNDAITVLKSKKKYLELYTPEYAGRIKEEWIIEKLLTQAGIRLAAVLNFIFAELEGDEIRQRRLTL